MLSIERVPGAFAYDIWSDGTHVLTETCSHEKGPHCWRCWLWRLRHEPFGWWLSWFPARRYSS